MGTPFVYQLSVTISPYGIPLEAKLSAACVGAAARIAELSEVSCGLSYQVDATELMAEASEVDSAAGIERVVPTTYAEITCPLTHVRDDFRINNCETYTFREVSSAALVRATHRARIVMGANFILT